MHRPHHYLAALFLTAAVAAPVSMLATPAPQEAGVQVRVYDRNHKDYHNWDDNENRAWGAYLTENHPSSRIRQSEQERAIAVLELAPLSSR